MTKEEEKAFNEFVDVMKVELNNNSYKGNFVEYAVTKNRTDIINELQYHLDKLALTDDIEKMREFSADVANIAMFMYTST